MIRPYRKEDLDEVAAVWLAASLQSFTFIQREHWLAKERDMREIYLPMCSDILVFEDDEAGGIAAFLAFVDEYLAALYVAPERQGMGIGSRLLRLAKKMRPYFYLTVYAKNTRAVAFYRRHGLAEDGTRIESETGEQEILMSWGHASE